MLTFSNFDDIIFLRKGVCRALPGMVPVQTDYASILQKIHFVGAGIGVMCSPAPLELQLSKINIF